MNMPPSARCRACGQPLQQAFADLGLSPVSNAFIKPERAQEGEMFYPLRAMVCTHCWLVQLAESPKADAHFHEDYVYFSSYSDSWLRHARDYVDQVTRRFGLGRDSKVMEIASNDGYLLQNFVRLGVPCLGIEPTANTAAVARSKGVETRECFFGRQTAAGLRDEGWQVDLLLGNNVLAHVPDILDFVAGFSLVLKPEGVVTLEFPHLLELIRGNQFDTIYHEHYSYLSLTALQPIFAAHGLRIFDVQTLSTHGGSLRVFLCNKGAAHETLPAVEAMVQRERDFGLQEVGCYERFAEAIRETKRKLLSFLIAAKREGKTVVAYGAAAKGNTLLNYCGVSTDFIDFVADRNPVKQGRLSPGTRIPVVAPEEIAARKPDYLLILPWNIRDEVVAQMAVIRQWGGQFVVPIPELTLI